MSIVFEETIPVGATPSAYVPTEPGSLVLEVTAMNAHGSTSARSAPFVVPGGSPVLNVHISAQTETTVTLAWTPLPGALGYLFTIDGSPILTDGKRHFTFDPTRSSVKIGRPPDGKPHRYGVFAFGELLEEGVQL